VALALSGAFGSESSVYTWVGRLVWTDVSGITAEDVSAADVSVPFGEELSPASVSVTASVF